MTQQETTQRLAIRGAKARVNPAPEISVRLVGALLALAVTTVHIADQGTITALTSPHWIGGGQRVRLLNYTRADRKPNDNQKPD